MAHQHAVSIHHVEVRFAVQTEIRNALVQSGQMVRHAIFDDAHQVFHGNGQVRGAVVFEDRHIDENIAIQDQAVHVRGFEDFASGNPDFAIAEVIHGDHDGAGGFGGFFDAAQLIAVAGV